MGQLVRRYMWLVPVVLGLAFVGAGVFMVQQGRAAKNEVRTALVGEKVTTSADARIPSTAVTNADTADAQADAILAHSLKTSNGLTYAEMKRDDPARATYLDGVSLRTALNLAVMGFKVSDLVVGIGAFIIVMGVSNIAFLAPALYWLRGPVTEKAPARVLQTQPATS